jgi:hypothetical protein
MAYFDGLFQNGLLGMGGINGGGQSAGMNSLLGQFYDPQELRRRQKKKGLLATGLALMAQEPSKYPINFMTSLGQGLSKGFEAANSEEDQYRQQAMQEYALKNQQDQQSYERNRQGINDQWTQQEHERQMAQQQAQDAMLQNVPETDRPFAAAYPQQYAQQMFEQRFAQPSRAAVPAGIQEYEYAKQQGFPGTFQDWEASKKGGMSLQVDPATGQVTFQQGSNIKPMTEAQSKDTIFSTRAEGALQLLDSETKPLAKNLTEFGSATLGQMPGVGNYMKSEGYQQAEQAGNEFLQAILRKDTGAAITPGESILYGATYLPQPGDGAQVLEQKKAARRRAVLAIKAGMTPQAILAQERALQQGAGENDPLGLR